MTFVAIKTADGYEHFDAWSIKRITTLHPKHIEREDGFVSGMLVVFTQGCSDWVYSKMSAAEIRMEVERARESDPRFKQQRSQEKCAPRWSF